MMYYNIGEKIKAIRQIRKIERKQVSEDIGLSVSQLANIENNLSGIDEEKLVKISEALNVSPEAILNFDSNRAINQNIYDSSIGINNGNVYNHNQEFIESFIKKQSDINAQLFELLKEINTSLKRNS